MSVSNETAVLQDVFDKATPEQKYNFLLLLKAQGVVLTGAPDGKISVNTEKLPPDLVQFMKRHVEEHGKPDDPPPTTETPDIQQHSVAPQSQETASIARSLSVM